MCLSDFNPSLWLFGDRYALPGDLCNLLAIKSHHPEVEGVAPVGQANYFQLVAECTKKKKEINPIITLVTSRMQFYFY